ncbi:MAG: PGPGW domain-containing protein [Desulfobacterium sp.]|nr:PGPGW domain-containing protein [Desulfobacterium sp.]
MVIEKNSVLFMVMSTLSLVTFIGSIVAVPWIVCKIPFDYFIQKQPHRAGLLVLIVRNCMGFVFVAAGIFMLVTPGQGVLTILVGLLIMSYPGKIEIERRILMVRGLRRALNWVRKKQGCTPMIFESSDRTDL